MAVAAGDDGIVVDQHARQIVFFDVETTVPFRTGQKYELLEFGAIVLDVQGLSEVDTYDTLIRPKDQSLITRRSVGCNGISKESVAHAPTFTEVADKIYRILNGRIWAGHNIVKFDMLRISEAFSETQRQAPEPAGIIDTYPLLKRTFGRRAGNLKLATLANYCGYGQQKHRSLDDVRMNVDVLRSCATMMFLESNYPDIFTAECELGTCTSTVNHSATLSVSQEQIRRSRNDFLPDEGGFPSKEPESVHVGISGSTGTRQISQENTRVPHVSFRMKKDGPSVVSESITASALTVEPIQTNAAEFDSRAIVKEYKTTCETCCTSNLSLNDADKDGKVFFSDLEAFKDGSCQNDTLTVDKISSKMDLANIEIASLEETKTGYSQVASTSASGIDFLTQRTEDHDILLKDNTALLATENAELDASITEAEVGVEEDCHLSAAFLSLSFSGVKDVQYADALDISGIEAHSSAILGDSDLRIAVGAARESFLLPSCVSLDLIEFVDENSHIGCKKALYHKGFPLQLWECETRMRFTINPTYAFDDKGKPSFSILIEPSERACAVISKCEDLVKGNMPAPSGEATWLPLLRNEIGVSGVRMRIGTTFLGGSATYSTKFYQLTSNGVREIALGKVDVAQFRNFLPHGSVIDVGFSFGVFSINGKAGVNLLAKYITLR